MPPERRDKSIGVNLIVLSIASIFAFGDCGELLFSNKSEPSAIARTGKGRNERRGRREEDCLPAPSLAHLAESHTTCGGRAGRGQRILGGQTDVAADQQEPHNTAAAPTHAQTCS